ncbi:PREDICTED: golgin candidate 5-like isoform X2 [Nelumbo nucifera]|uniref:Golgin candidate 5-like isoform X2 n=1 Tax=Nelumbo nucifera TaxID=4432 RepID=A0A1U7ZNK6_NELNU|nr:PREDICTED: golgin candidate 5-like isoform X2 [Nelumbo nucifera]
MAWLGKVSLGGFPDLAGAVTKLSESVKNIEKNFDSALGLEDKSDTGETSGPWSSATDRKALFEPVMSFIGHKVEENFTEPLEKAESSVQEKERTESDAVSPSSTEQIVSAKKENEALEVKEESEHTHSEESMNNVVSDPRETKKDPQSLTMRMDDTITGTAETTRDSLNSLQKKESLEVGLHEEPQLLGTQLIMDEVEQAEANVLPPPGESSSAIYLSEGLDEQKTKAEVIDEESPIVKIESLHDQDVGAETETSISSSTGIVKDDDSREPYDNQLPNAQAPDMASESVSHTGELLSGMVETNQHANNFEIDTKEQHLNSRTNISDTVDSVVEMEKMKMEMKMMEAALQGAARQAQAKADEIAKLMTENEQLKAIIVDLKKKSSESEVESLREEYHQRVATLERKVYALTKERDTLRREQNKKNDAVALLKEKDEIINQVMAEGEELSKKQAAQESQIRKLRAQIREFEEEKKGLITRLQVEENKVESIKRDKAATEKLLQETIEKHQAELSSQKEYYMNALNEAKEAEALAEARANNEARTELECRLREAEEREATLVQALEELRQTLTQKEHQAVFREDMLRRDIEDLQKRYQASERRCEELITQVPESTRPLLRQIEAMQETTARRAEAWAAVERSLNSRLQEAEAKAAAAEESERSVNERLSQTLSRTNVLEAQISCLGAEQTQLNRSLEKERQRAAENRQEYLAAKEEADTLEGRVSQLEEEVKELKKKHKQELQDALAQRELLQQELEREKTARLDLERTTHIEPSAISDQALTSKPCIDNGNASMQKLSNARSLGSMEESFFLQASLSDSFSEQRHLGILGIHS